MQAAKDEQFWHRDKGDGRLGQRRKGAESPQTPLTIEVSVVRRSLPDGTILGRFGPFSSQSEAERFILERLRGHD